MITLEEAEKVVDAAHEKRDDAIECILASLETGAFDTILKIQDTLGEDFSMIVFALTELQEADKEFCDALDVWVPLHDASEGVADASAAD